MKQSLLCLFWAASLCAQSFEAGTARRDVTPKEPVPMWGYGDRHDKLSQGVMDPLYAEALVMNLGGAKLAIVGLDLGRAPTQQSLERIRTRIRKEAGIEYSFIGGSHTHHGPVLELTDADGKGRGKFDATLRYYTQMENAIADAVVEANSKLQPARLATGSVHVEGFNVNRHTKFEPKPSDKDLAVMRIDTAEGKPLAVLVNWAAHPTTLPSSTMQFSADYVGVLKQRIAAETGASALFIQGAAGDQSIDRSKGDYKSYGTALAAEVLKLDLSLTPQSVDKPSLKIKEERLHFTPRVDLRNPFIATMFDKAFFPELVSNYQDEYANGVQPLLTVALVNGDIALVGASGEFFSNHAIQLKKRARVKQLFFFGYCNGYHQYFPTIEAVAEGGYGADPTVAPAAVGAGEQIMNTALTWIYQMLGKIPEKSK